MKLLLFLPAFFFLYLPNERQTKVTVYENPVCSANAELDNDCDIEMGATSVPNSFYVYSVTNPCGITTKTDHLPYSEWYYTADYYGTYQIEIAICPTGGGGCCYAYTSETITPSSTDCILSNCP